MKKTITILLIVMNISGLYSQVNAKVVSIKDGDTVVVLDKFKPVVHFK